MAAFRSLRQINSKLNMQEINKNISSERPRAIAATHYMQGRHGKVPKFDTNTFEK